MPKPKEFKENEDRLTEAQAAGNSIAVSQLLFSSAVSSNQRAVATAVRYAAEPRRPPRPRAPPRPRLQAEFRLRRVRQARAGWAPRTRSRSGCRGAEQGVKAGAAEAGQAGQAGDAAGQLAQLLPAALGAIGGLAGGVAGMVGQIPQALMQTGQGLAQTATQGLSGLASKKPTDAELAKSVERV